MHKGTLWGSKKGHHSCGLWTSSGDVVLSCEKYKCIHKGTLHSQKADQRCGLWTSSGDVVLHVKNISACIKAQFTRVSKKCKVITVVGCGRHLVTLSSRMKNISAYIKAHIPRVSKNGHHSCGLWMPSSVVVLRVKKYKRIERGLTLIEAQRKSIIVVGYDRR